MKQYKVTHITTYEYDHPVTLCHNEAYLIPRNTVLQKCQQSNISVKPEPSVYEKLNDFYQNNVVYFALQYPHSKLEVKAESIIENNDNPPYKLNESTPWDELFVSENGKLSKEQIEAKEFNLASPLIPVDPIYADYAKKSFTPKRPVLEAAMDLTSRIFKEFEYDPAATTVSTPVQEVFLNKKGVCQDFAHFAIACLRSLFVPARYVSGYLETLPPPGKPRLVGADASHAWFSVYDPKIGWMDFDPTNNKIPDSQYITVAWGRDYSDIPPLRGVSLGGSNQILSVSVDVAPIQPEVVRPAQQVQQQTQQSQQQQSMQQTQQLYQQY